MTKMKRLFKVLVCLLAFVAVAPISDASLVSLGGARHFTSGGGSEPGAADLFTAAYTSELGNWDTFVGDEFEPEFFDRTLVVGGGPRGLNAIQFAGVPASGLSDRVMGGHRVTLANQADNVWRYFRWYWRADPSNNYRAADLGRIIHKLLILGDSGSDDRYIFDAQGILDDGPQFFSIFDGVGEVGTPESPPSPYNDGDWIPIQTAVRWGTGGVAAFKAWIDTDVFASPTYEITTASVTNSNNGEVSFGSYCNDEVAATGVFTFRVAAFRVATTFDSNWAGWPDQ